MEVDAETETEADAESDADSDSETEAEAEAESEAESEDSLSLIESSSEATEFDWPIAEYTSYDDQQLEQAHGENEQIILDAVMIEKNPKSSKKAPAAKKGKAPKAQAKASKGKKPAGGKAKKPSKAQSKSKSKTAKAGASGLFPKANSKKSKSPSKSKKGGESKAKEKKSKKSSEKPKKEKKQPKSKAPKLEPKKRKPCSKNQPCGKKRRAPREHVAPPGHPSNCRSGKCGDRVHGHGIAPGARLRVQQRLPEPRLTGAASTLTRANVRCVLCQFITQKIKNGLTGEDGASSASLIEAFAFASAGAQSKAESAVQAVAYADAAAAAIPPMFDRGHDAPRRFRHTDVLAHRAGRARFTQVRSGASVSEEDRAAYLKLYSTVYASFEDLCAKKMPLAYLPYCNDMLKSYRFFAQGINYGDRPEQICMNGNFCAHNSYVRRVTHNIYERQPGDA